MTVLVGSTGFVGSNILAAAGGEIGWACHSADVKGAYGLRPDLLIYAGLPAAKYLANHAPEKDLEVIRQAEENIRAIAPKKMVLISTIDVFPTPNGVDETSRIDPSLLHPYGRHRYLLELWAREFAPDGLIIRLPGLFGRNLKKNFIYDLLHPAPSMLTRAKLDELGGRDPVIREYYGQAENGFCRQKPLSPAARLDLERRLQALGFTALNFTDSRSVFQFYPLGRLWDDIQTALAAGLTLWHPATPPVSAAGIYRALTGREFRNLLPGPPADYDYRTCHAGLFGGGNGYICGREELLEEIIGFVRRESAAQSETKH